MRNSQLEFSSSQKFPNAPNCAAVGPSTQSVSMCWGSYFQQRFLTRRNRSSRSEKIIFVAQVLSVIRLSEAHDTSRIQPPRLGSAASGDAKAERHVVHAIDDDTLVLRAILGEAADMGLDDVAAVEEGLIFHTSQSF